MSLVDIARLAAEATGAYDNREIARVNDHVVRLSVMTEPFYWHRHPNSDETFLVIDGVVLLELGAERIELREGQMATAPADVPHRTRPLTPRSVNVTFERADMETERVEGPE